MPVNVLSNSSLTSAVSSRVASSGFLAKIVISDYNKMKESINNRTRSNFKLSTRNGYVIYLQNNNRMENSMDSMNIIYNLDQLLDQLDCTVSDGRRYLDDELGNYRSKIEELKEKIEQKEQELNEEEDETTQIKLNDELQEMNNDFNTMNEEDERKCELISRHDSIIDDIYTVSSKFAKAIFDAITTDKYDGVDEAYIIIRSDCINTSLTNIFEETDVLPSELFEEYEVVDVEFDDEEDVEEEGEEHTEETDEDGFQRLPEPVLEDVNNIDDDPSSDDESDDPSTEEEIKDDKEKQEFITKNSFSYCNGCKQTKCSCFNEDEYEEVDVATATIIRLCKKIEKKDEEIEKLKALLKMYIK